MLIPPLRLPVGRPMGRLGMAACDARLGFHFKLWRQFTQIMAALPRFNFTRLLFDLVVEHNTPPPVFIPARHPFPGHFAIVCQYNSVDAIGGGGSNA